MTEPVALTVKDMRSVYGISKSSVYREIKAGRLKTKKYGATTLITGESARALFLSLPDGSTTQSTNKAGISGKFRGRLGKRKRENASEIKDNETSRNF